MYVDRKMGDFCDFFWNLLYVPVDPQILDLCRIFFSLIMSQINNTQLCLNMTKIVWYEKQKLMENKNLNIIIP